MHTNRQTNVRMYVARLPLTSMDLVQVLLLPHKWSLRCSKCCTCHVKLSGANESPVVARLPLTSMELLQVLHLARKPTWSC